MDVCGKKIYWITNEEVDIKRNMNTLMLNIQAIYLQEDSITLKGMLT